jgi:hypothetical protein
MISDEKIRQRLNAIGTKDGVTLILDYTFIPVVTTMTRYEAFRLSSFLDRAIMDSCRLSGKKVDDGFAG